MVLASWCLAVSHLASVKTNEIGDGEVIMLLMLALRLTVVISAPVRVSEVKMPKLHKGDG